MSSSEENFNLDVSDGSESEDYAPAPKKAAKGPAKSKAAAASKTKAPSKPRVTKKKVLADKDDNVNVTEDDNSADEGAGPSAMRDEEPAPAIAKKKKTASETYTKLSQLEHILKRPDSYIGSVETITQTMWVWDSEDKRMVNREIKYVPGFFKIVDEILVNAADNKVNDPSMDTIKVTIDVENNIISVYNNGRGIPIEMHSQEKIYIPELIFGHLLSSSNYDDDEKKLTGGRNGYGAKLANIYSTEFTIDTADKNTGQKYVQTWSNNMSKIGKAKITKNSRGEEYTKVSFKPDLKRFGMDSIDEDTVSLLRRRVHDLAGTVKDVKVYLNDERLKTKNFKQYVELYLNSVAGQAEEESGGAAQAKASIIYERIDSRWEIAYAPSDGSFQQVSFANSISTSKGGTHVQYITDQIAKALITQITKKNKGAAVKPAQIKNHMWIFVNALIENPTFDSQTKETLTLPASKFGTKPSLSEDFMKKIVKSGIIDSVLHWAQHKADLQMKKTDGNRRSRLTGLPKLSDANNAGTKHAKDCTLILTEGDSAKSLAIAGLSVVGRDNFGVFPLRGKLLNVRDARHDQIMKNEEIQAIKKILGLQHNKEYKDTSSLRYGRLMIMTDQDHDGSHIKGLLINYLDHFYPSLLKIPNFLVEFITPIVRVWKGKQEIDFYNMPQFEQFMQITPGSEKLKTKYYKGLGTSTDKDAQKYFKFMGKHMIPFSTVQEGDKESIELAFSKKKADERKEWLRQFKPGTFLDHTQSEIKYTEFINQELILFSMADNIRSIPSIADGLKPGQRKVIWSCFKRNLKSEIKVLQLAGYVSEVSAYHHGEASLMATIINLAHDFVGSNNINLLEPNGQYGTRDQGGSDHASPRYIFTDMSPLTRKIFRPEDNALLAYQLEDGKPVEPDYYMPVVPMVLINGAEGIGTGWSTSIPPYNPEDIVANITRLMNGEELVPMLPWWRGFNGSIKKTAENKYDVTGVVNKIDDNTVEITELPIGRWTSKYKLELEAMCGEKGDGPVKDFQEHHTTVNVHFVVNMSEKGMQQAEEQGLLEYFKLTSKISTSNMICFDFDRKIKKYASPEAIIEDFYPKRLAFYQKRKDYLAGELQDQFDKLTNQARFVRMIVDKELVVSNRKKTEIVSELRKKEFRPFPVSTKGDKDADDENDEEEETGTNNNSTDYDYLLRMPIWSLTKEKIEKLLKQAADKEAELLALLETTPITIWQKDLDVFLQGWKDTYDRWLNKMNEAKGDIGKVKKGKRKQATLKDLVKKKGNDDDSEDDFKPTKAAPKARKQAESKPIKKSSSVVPSGSDIKMDEDDDVDPVPAPPARKAVRKRKVDSGSESDFEASAAKRKAAPKAATKIEDSDIEVVEKPAPVPKKKLTPPKKEGPETDDDDAVVVSKTKGKGKAAPKRKSPEVEAEDTDDEMNLQPPKKKQAGPQSSVTDFFDKVPAAAAAKKAPAKKPSTNGQAATARKASSTSQGAASKGRAAATKKPSKKVIDSDDEDMFVDDDDDDKVPAPPPTRAPPKRAARGVQKKYIELLSDDDDEEPSKDGSDFEDFD